MSPRLRIGLSTAALTASFLLSGTVVAGDGDNSALLHRMAALEARVSALEGRPATGTSPASLAWQDTAKWNQLRVGMREQEVVELLGPPSSGQRMRTPGALTGEITAMLYQQIDSANLAGAVSGIVHLADGRVTGWSAPYLADATPDGGRR